VQTSAISKISTKSYLGFQSELPD